MGVRSNLPVTGQVFLLLKDQPKFVPTDFLKQYVFINETDFFFHFLDD